MKKFKKTGRLEANEKTDLTGELRIYIHMMDSSNNRLNKKDNITKTLRIEDAKVSEVFSAIEKALF